MPDNNIPLQPTRIEPVLDAVGQPVHLDPPSGGSWQRDADGGLSPADEGTALLAGLRWPSSSTDVPHQE